MMPEIAHEEESSLLRAVSALRERTQKGGGEEFGLQKGMALYQMLATAVENIKRRSGAGEDLEDLITKATGGEEVSGRALRGLVGQGPEGFARWRRVMEAVPANQLDQSIQESRKTESGRQFAVNSRLEVERARMGMRNDEISRRAVRSPRRSYAFRSFRRPANLGEWAASNLPGADDRRNIQINQQMLRRLRFERGEMTGPTGEVRRGDTKAALNAGTTDKLMRQLLAKTDETNKHLAEQNAMMKADQRQRRSSGESAALRPAADAAWEMKAEANLPLGSSGPAAASPAETAAD